METTPAHELDEVRRLRAETLTEARKIPRGAFVVIAVALVAWFAGYALVSGESNAYPIAWVGVWWIFFIAWSVWVGRQSRARNPTEPLTRSDTWRRIVEWTMFFALGQAIVWFGKEISWVLVGVLLAALTVGQGLLNRERWLRWYRHGAR